MEILNATAAARFAVDEDLLNFTLGGGEGEGEGEEEEVDPAVFKGASSSSSSLSKAAVFGRGALTGSFPEFVEEELEWLSNKDAFPSVETCFGILSDNPELISDRHSPVSVLENITITTSNSNSNSSGSIASCCNSLKVPTNYPVRARSKRRRRTTKSGFVSDSPSQQCFWVNYVDKRKRESPFSLPPPPPVPARSNGGAGMGRRCLHCQSDKTPQWRAGPMGPKTLCNACGVRYKSGRLLPEYRPANSPTFSSVLHSNSHRKVVEMRRKKQVGETCGYRVG